jgi:hypothetical protein
MLRSLVEEWREMGIGALIALAVVSAIYGAGELLWWAGVRI